jgi:hypothetical protein
VFRFSWQLSTSDRKKDLFQKDTVKETRFWERRRCWFSQNPSKDPCTAEFDPTIVRLQIPQKANMHSADCSAGFRTSRVFCTANKQNRDTSY